MYVGLTCAYSGNSKCLCSQLQSSSGAEAGITAGVAVVSYSRKSRTRDDTGQVESLRDEVSVSCARGGHWKGDEWRRKGWPAAPWSLPSLLFRQAL